MSRGNANTAGIQTAIAEKAEADRIAAEKAEADRIAAEKAETDRIAAENAEADRIAAENAETDRIAAENAETDRIADLAAQYNFRTHDGGEGGAAGYVQGENDVSLPAAGVFPKRGPVRILAKSDTNAVVTDDVEQWTVALADGDPTQSIPPSLLHYVQHNVHGDATPTAHAPKVIAESATHRILDNGVRRWKEEIA